MKRALDPVPTPVIVYLERGCKYCISLVTELEDLCIDYKIHWVDESDSNRERYLEALAVAGYGPDVAQTPAVAAGHRLLPCNPPIGMIRNLLGENTSGRVGRRDAFGRFSQGAGGQLPKGRLH